MSRAERREIERVVQDLERKHPEWTALQIEKELADRAPVATGNWRDDTPALDSRLRQIQRWRTGFRAGGRKERAQIPYPYLWPMGEKQRQGLQPTFPARTGARRASHRLFLYNCSVEILREVRARLHGVEVAYEPAMPPGAFAELHWTRYPGIRESMVAVPDNRPIEHPLGVEFAVANGTKRASLEGSLVLRADDGWVAFRSRDRSEKEIE